MKYLFLFVCFGISGCSEVSAMFKSQQNYACKDHGGVYQYVGWSGKAHCRDGARIDGWYDLILPSEFMPRSITNG